MNHAKTNEMISSPVWPAAFIGSLHLLAAPFAKHQARFDKRVLTASSIYILGIALHLLYFRPECASIQMLIMTLSLQLCVPALLALILDIIQFFMYSKKSKLKNLDAGGLNLIGETPGDADLPQ